MPQDKLAFVGAKKGELTLMVGPNGIHMGIDLAMPNLAPFVIQAPLDGEGPLELLFVDLIESLTGLVQGYLEAQGVDTEILDALTQNIKGAVSALDHRYTEQRYSENGSGVLDTVRDLETETLFEAEFDLPEGFLQQAHTKVVTANAAIVRRTPQFQPKAVKTGPQTSILQRPTPSLKNIIQKYRTQQGKPLSGPLFVLVYDSTGRPVGVRSIKGPGWSGNGGGGKVASVQHTNERCTACGGHTRCKCMTSSHRAAYPPDGNVPETEGVCWGCREKAKTASRDTIEVKGWGITPDEVTVYVNPSRGELQTLIGGEGARALVYPKQNKVIAWSGLDAIHDQVAQVYPQLLGLIGSQGIPVHIYPGPEVVVSAWSKRGPWYHNPETGPALMNCGALHMALGGPLKMVEYFDEDVAGDWEKMEPASASLQPINAGLKTSSVGSFRRLVVARDAGAIVGALVFADYPRDRRILSMQVTAPGTGVEARMLACLGSDKPVVASAKTFENEGLEELGFKPVGNQLVKAAGPAAATLQPDTVLQVFTGCSPEDATRYCAEGIDTEHVPSYRRYPHTDLGLPVHGLIVTSDPHDATGLGPIVLQLKVAADALHDLHPSQEADLDESNREQFPDSFRPSLSWVLTQERRALFMGAVAPQAIQAIERIRR